jgi:hypothetical protein
MIKVKIKKLVVGEIMTEKYKWYQTLWWLTKRLLRTTVPQIPAVLAWSGTVFPQSTLPYLVAAGGVLTVVDKLFRDKGYYG